jgi:hypothetical protein
VNGLPSPRRRLVVNLCVAGFVLGSAVSLITQRELWPFSPYAMFAALQGPEQLMLDVVGVSAASSEEILLAPSPRTKIIAGTRYREMLNRLVEIGSEGEIRTYLSDVAHRYEDERPADAPRLRAVRLYKSRWRAMPDEWPPARRVEQVLLTEIDSSR